MSSSLLRIKRCFQTCDVAELYLLVACRSSTRGQGLTFTSARVLARALFRASGYTTFGTPITSRPLGREVPLRSRARVSCVTATGRMTVEEMCGLSLRLTYGHRVRALLVLAPPDPGALFTFCLFPEAFRCCFKKVSHRRYFLPPCALSPRHSLSPSLCVSRPQGLSLLPGEGECSTARGPFSVGLRSVSVPCCEQRPSYHRFAIAGAVFFNVPSLSLARPAVFCFFSSLSLPPRRRRRVMPCCISTRGNCASSSPPAAPALLCCTWMLCTSTP